MKNFNSNNASKGKKYEELVELDLLNRGYLLSNGSKKIYDAGISVDYIASKGDIIEYGEAKGGLTLDSNTGARRTDNVKKAIANGALLKATTIDARYVVYFSNYPLPNSASERMLQTAVISGLIDEIRYLCHNESPKLAASQQ
tara:strand:- start:2222 stop:2650 length:429 start_codon:yes stop_codon:yes gene_type:complete